MPITFPATDPGRRVGRKRLESPVLVRESQVRRLFWGMAIEVAEKGFAAAAVVDVCARAHVSSRTFYENYPNKEALFVALHQATSDFFISYVEESLAAFTSWPDRLMALSRAPIEAVTSHPAYFQGLMIAAMTSGPGVLELRRHHHQRYAEIIQRELSRARDSDPILHQLTAPLSSDLALAISEGGEAVTRTCFATGVESAFDRLSSTHLRLITNVGLANVVLDELEPDRRRLGLETLVGAIR